MDLTPPPKAAVDQAFERKVRASRRSIIIEQVWLRLWALFGVAGLFVLVSFLGLWPRLGFAAHVAALAGFGIAAVGALIFASWVRVPSRETSIRRIERTSDLPHRPASSYEDTLSSRVYDPTTEAIWQAHRARLAALLSKLRVDRKSVV